MNRFSQKEKKKKNSFQRTWTTCLIPTLLICVLSQRIEANLCNKSHPSLCYCNTNYIIGSSSWRHAWHCRKMCARNAPTPPDKPAENRKCVLSGGGRGLEEGGVCISAMSGGDSLFRLMSFHPGGLTACSQIKQDLIEFQTQQLFFRRLSYIGVFMLCVRNADTLDKSSRWFICPAPVRTKKKRLEEFLEIQLYRVFNYALGVGRFKGTHIKLLWIILSNQVMISGKWHCCFKKKKKVWYFEYQCHLVPSTVKLSQRDTKQLQRHKERHETTWSGQDTTMKRNKIWQRDTKNTTKGYRTNTKIHKTITESDTITTNILQRHKTTKNVTSMSPK